jgi:hypothetical protein
MLKLLARWWLMVAHIMLLKAASTKPDLHWICWLRDSAAPDIRCCQMLTVEIEPVQLELHELFQGGDYARAKVRTA